ncbi:MAG: hypothetical protein DWQ02_23950 [Bacteroidetes bacterium]|nr:MAG: hypothetical protein DWQ02_23950 [Bacteroidota bacterium]
MVRITDYAHKKGAHSIVIRYFEEVFVINFNQADFRFVLDRVLFHIYTDKLSLCFNHQAIINYKITFRQKKAFRMAQKKKSLRQIHYT